MKKTSNLSMNKMKEDKGNGEVVLTNFANGQQEKETKEERREADKDGCKCAEKGEQYRYKKYF